MVNKLFQEYSTKKRFTISLSAAQCEVLVMLHRRDYRETCKKFDSRFVQHVRGLCERGFVDHHPPGGLCPLSPKYVPYTVTREGKQVARLIIASGILDNE